MKQISATTANFTLKNVRLKQQMSNRICSTFDMHNNPISFFIIIFNNVAKHKTAPKAKSKTVKQFIFLFKILFHPPELYNVLASLDKNL